jgi:hypothetical protein
VLVELDTRRAARRSAETGCVQAIGLVAVTVGCLALGDYMGRDLTGGAAIALSVDAAISRVGLNSVSDDGRPRSSPPLLARAASAHSQRQRDQRGNTT